MVTVVVVAAVAMASVVGSLIAMTSWAVSARILIEANFGLFNVGIPIDGPDHLTNPLWQLTIEFGVEVTVMESSNEGDDDLSFRDVGNRIPHLGKASDVAMEELERLLVDVVQIMLGTRPSTRSHIVVSEDLLQFFSGSDGVRGKACEPVHGGWREHDGKIIRHDTGISSGGAHSSGVSL